MQSLFKLRSCQFWRLGGALLLLAVACGAAATATPAAPPTTVPATTTGAPTAPKAPLATAGPAATPTLAATAVNPGKLTWMIGGWGNERFSYNYGVGGGNNYGRFLHGFVIATNERLELIPGIASKWEFSKDGKTWTFTIRDGAKFQDGKTITAEDVWWSWMHYWGKDASGSAVERVTLSSAQSRARITDKIELTAHDQVSITSKFTDTVFPAAWVSEASSFWYGVLPKRPKVHDSAQESAYDKNPIGAGLMKLVKHVPAEVMSFERFDDYYYQPKNGLPEDRRVKFKSLDLRVVPEEATRVAALRAGEADIAPASLATRKQVEAGGGRMQFGPEGVYVLVRLYGCFKPQYPCNDKRVRQALDYAIDKNQFQKLFGGPEVFQIKGWSGVTPSTLGYSPDLDPWPQDLVKARQLLAAAGYPGGKGVGKLIVNTWVSSAMPFLPETAQLAADVWRRELGLDVEVKVGEEAALKKARLGGGLDGTILWRDNEGNLEATYTDYFISDNPTRVSDSQELRDFVNQQLAVTDPSQRSAAVNRLNLRLREETHELGIGYVNVPWGVGPRVVQWTPYPLAFYPSGIHTIVLKQP